MMHLTKMIRTRQKLEFFMTPVPTKKDLHLMSHKGLALAYFQNSYVLVKFSTHRYAIVSVIKSVFWNIGISKKYKDIRGFCGLTMLQKVTLILLWNVLGLLCLDF